MTAIPNNGQHIASSQSEQFTTTVLFTGEVDVITTSETVADSVIASVDLPANSVVGRDSSGKIVLATYNSTPASGVPAMGITTETVKTGATVKTVAVYRSGMFNPDALNWHSSYDTDAKKRLAFEYLANQIIIQKPLFA